jgi:two-component system, chemotaxis family, protein-glutamate methylesterase/glutaminase
MIESTKIKVLIIDDSALVRDILRKGLSEDPGIEVVGTASDVYIARDKIVRKKPDVLTLDVEMPRMDGIEFLKKLMPQYPLPVVMVSAMTGPGARSTLEALEHGAIDYVLKPSSSFGIGLNGMMAELKQKIKYAATVDVKKWKNPLTVPRRKPLAERVLEGGSDKIIAIGASTGGTVALRSIINEFPASMPGTVIVQHMPPKFTEMFADKLNETSAVTVKEAENGDRVLRGRVLIAPGGKHMKVQRSGGHYLVSCSEGPLVNGHAPSVDVLFDSLAVSAGPNVIGAVLTGMGSDGAKGLKAMRDTGARTLAQDEATSVIYGMPKEAFLQGGAEIVVPLHGVTSKLLTIIKSMENEN